MRLLGLPVEIHRRSGEHQEALRRELAFIEHAHAADAAPARLHALGDELTGRYGSAHRRPRPSSSWRPWRPARPRIDLEFELPPDIVDATVQLGALLEELDDFCREGDLLTLVTPPDLLAYRRWVLGEFTSQIRDGQPPRPWANHVAAPAPAAAAEDVEPETGAASASRTTSTSPRAPAVRQALLDRIDQGRHRHRRRPVRLRLPRLHRPQPARDHPPPARRAGRRSPDRRRQGPGPRACSTCRAPPTSSARADGPRGPDGGKTCRSRAGHLPARARGGGSC